MNAIATVEQLVPRGDSPTGRRHLLGLGYPVLPLLEATKKPLIKRWTTRPITPDTLTEMERQHPDHRGSCIRTGNFAVADIDLVDPAIARKVSDFIEARLGLTRVYRIGSKPAGALAYYNRTPIQKIAIRADGKTAVEFLGKGQQLACFGEHPDTGRPYRWPDLSPMDVPLEGLPEVTPPMIRETVPELMTFLKSLGCKDVGLSCSAGMSDSVAVTGSVKSHDLEPIKRNQLLAMLKTPGLFEDNPQHPDPALRYFGRGRWIALACALKYAPIVLEDGSEDTEVDRFALFHWISRQPNRGSYAGPEDCLRTWNSLAEEDRRDTGADLRMIIREARRCGYTGQTAYNPTAVRAAISDRRVKSYYAGCGIGDDEVPSEPYLEDMDPDERQEYDESIDRQHDTTEPKSTPLVDFELPDSPDDLTEDERKGVYMVGDLCQLPDIEWAVKEILPEQCLRMVYGDTGSLKTFSELNLALFAGQAEPKESEPRMFAPLEGDEVYPEGFKIARTLKTVFVVGEGPRGLKKRIRAWCQRHKVDESTLAVLVIDNMPVISTDEGFRKLVRQVYAYMRDVDHIVLDTLMWAAGPLNVSDPTGSAEMLRTFKRIMTIFDCGLTFVHHIGKDDKRGHLGAHNWKASIDVVDHVTLIEKSAGRRLIMIENIKLKDEETRPPIYFLATLEEIGRDGDGKAITSLVMGRCAAPVTSGKGGENQNREKAVKVLSHKIGKVFSMNGLAKEMMEHTFGDPKGTDEKIKAKTANAFRHWLKRDDVKAWFLAEGLLDISGNSYRYQMSEGYSPADIDG